MTQHPTPNTHHPDTIAAVATAPGPCGIGIIRISGADAFTVAGRVFRHRSNLTPSDFLSHTVHYGKLVHPESFEPIDDVLLTVFREPASYTGENTVEISCHGGAVTLRRALDTVFLAGARTAAPGEFTKRAFLNGRLDLAQAEAVNDLIRARTDDAQRIALRQLGGTLSSEVRGAMDGIMSMLARIEAAVDFPEDVEEPDYKALATEIEEEVFILDKLISMSNRGRIYREGITLAIVGRPNVGKSSLLNALLRQSRAIVTPIPGTTRDVIEETIDIKGIPVVAADTAGLRDATDEVEQIGIDLAERTMAAANIVIVVLDASEGVTEEDKAIIHRAGSDALIILNKIDKVSSQNLSMHVDAIPISAVTGEGIEALEDKIAAAVLHGDVDAGEALFVTNLRHKQALMDAGESLMRALDTIKEGLPVDFLSVDLIAARMSLGEITGDTASVDLIDRIFADFCIGK